MYSSRIKNIQLFNQRVEKCQHVWIVFVAIDVGRNNELSFESVFFREFVDHDINRPQMTCPRRRIFVYSISVNCKLRSPVSAIHAHVQHYIGNVFLFLYGEHFLTLGATFFLWRDFFFTGATFFRGRDFFFTGATFSHRHDFFFAGATFFRRRDFFSPARLLWRSFVDRC